MSMTQLRQKYLSLSIPLSLLVTPCVPRSVIIDQYTHTLLGRVLSIHVDARRPLALAHAHRQRHVSSLRARLKEQRYHRARRGHRTLASTIQPTIWGLFDACQVATPQPCKPEAYLSGSAVPQRRTERISSHPALMGALTSHRPCPSVPVRRVQICWLRVRSLRGTSVVGCCPANHPRLVLTDHTGAAAFGTDDASKIDGTFVHTLCPICWVRRISNARHEPPSVGLGQCLLLGRSKRSTKLELDIRYQGRLGVLG